MAAASASLRAQQACGERVLRVDGPSTDESLEQWAQRVAGDSTGWLAERSALRDELQRLSKRWLERGWIDKPRDGVHRIIYEHCRGVSAFWRLVFEARLGVMPKGWLRTVKAFDALWKRAEADLEARKGESGVAMKRHAMQLQYSDVIQLAGACLTSAHKAGSLTDTYKLVLAHQTLTHGLLGPRGQKLSVKQTYSMSFYHHEFGAGTDYASELFRYNPCEKNPPAIDLEHTPKGGTARTPLVLIPGRIFCLCPIFSTGLVRILQYGATFLRGCPPTWQPAATKPDWPFLITTVGSISSAPAQLDTSVLTNEAKAIGLSTEGGILSQLRHLNVLETTADPSCSTELAHRAAEHGRSNVPDSVYKSHHADLTLQLAHYKGDDPRIDAYLCAITELFGDEHEPHLTEMVLSLLSPEFRAAYSSYLAGDRIGVARNFFETVLFSVKVVLIRSRCRMSSSDFRIYEDSVTPLQTFKLLDDLLLPVRSHPYLSTMDAVIARHEKREMQLGIDATFRAETLQSMDSAYRANMAGVSSLLAQQTASICGYTQTDLDSLEEERGTGLISEETYQHRLAHAKARLPGGRIEKQITMRLSPTGFAARHGLPMETAEQQQRAAIVYELHKLVHPSAKTRVLKELRHTSLQELLELRRDIYYPNDVNDEDNYNRFETGRKRDREGTPKPLPSTSLSLAPPRSAGPSAPPPTSPPAPAPLALGEQPMNEFKVRAKLAVGKLSTAGTVGQVVARYLHDVLPFELDGRDIGFKLDKNQRDTLSEVRAVLYRSLSLTVDDAGEPQPSRLAYELHKLVLSTAKIPWAKEIVKTSLQNNMKAFVFGGGTERKPVYETARANLALMQAGIPPDGATFPEPSAAPAPPPPDPTERFFVACDPGISHSDFGVARLFVSDTTIVRIDYDSFHLPRLPPGMHVDYNKQGERMTFLRTNLQPIISGAAACFIENHRANSATIRGLDTNFFCRAVPIQLAYESGAEAQAVENKSWQAHYGYDETTRRTKLFDALCSPNLAHDTSKQAIDRLDIIDAICIGLHALQKRGFAIGLRSPLARMP